MAASRRSLQHTGLIHATKTMIPPPEAMILPASQIDGHSAAEKREATVPYSVIRARQKVGSHGQEEYEQNPQCHRSGEAK